MAIKLNKYAALCRRIAIANGKITKDSSATPFLYDISRHWRKLLDATNFKSSNDGRWSEKEEAASEVIISSIIYLKHLGCKDIEKLLEDTVERYARQK